MIRRTPLLLLLATLVLVAGIVVWRERATISPPQAVTDPAALHAAWKKDVSAVLSRYDADQRADTARDALVALRVAAQDRELHLALVLAFAAQADGAASAATRIDDARKAFLASP